MKSVMKGLNKFILVTYDILKNISAIVLLATLLITTVSIFCRYVLNNSLSWAEELCCFLLVWLAYLAAGMATVEKSHVCADFISTRIRGAAKTVMSWIVRILEIVFFITIAVAVVKLVPNMNQISAALEIPRKFYYYPIVGMSIYMAFAIVVDMLNDLFPGYNYWRQRQDELDKAAAEEEEALMQESLESVKEFMDETGGGAQ